MFSYKVDEIVDRIFIGNFAAANNRRLMSDYGFTHVLVTAAELPTPYPKQFTYLKIDVQDTLTEDIRQHFDLCLDFIDNALKVKGNSVLVHCMQGVSRSATIVIAYLMKHKKFSLSQALNHVSFRRPEIRPNPGFMSQLEHYNAELKAEREACSSGGCLCMIL